MRRPATSPKSTGAPAASRLARMLMAGALFAAAGGATARAADAPVAAEAEFTPHFHPTLEISRATGPIRLDGNLTDPGWRGAARADGFAEVSPGDQTKPPVDSEAWVTFDDENLYVALIARDDPDDVRVSVCDRDNIFSDDYFGIMLDTYGDLAWGYELFVNPIGIQGDLRMLSSGNEDGSFDMIWESEGKVTEDGYQVEIAIPFRSLRFPTRDEHVWRLNFWRDHQRDARRRYAWAAQDRNDNCFMCQWGTMTGLRGIAAGRDLEIITNVIGTQTGSLVDSDDPQTSFDDRNPDGEGSLNVRYGISSTASAEIAVNPDFSQVESDAGQIDVNQTFALFFPERRPFFQEGSDLYDTWIDAIYTRSVNAPDFAGKLVGDFGGMRAAYTFAHDDRSPLVVPFLQQSEVLEIGDSISNMLRVRRSLGGSSYVGGLATDRRISSNGGGSGSTGGLDGLFRFRRSWRLEWQAVASRTEELDDPTLGEDFDGEKFDGDAHTAALDGETYWGHAIYASLERGARTWNSDFDYWEYSPTFRTDNGFTTRNDYRQVSWWNGLEYSPNNRGIRQWELSAGIGRVWDYRNRFKDEWIRPNVWFDLPAQTGIWTEYLISRERFGTDVFDGIRIFATGVDSRFSELVVVGADLRIGQGIYRDFDDPQLADQRSFGAYVRVKATRRVENRTDWDYARMDSRAPGGEELFAGYIVRNRLSVNFTREWFLRLVTQWNTFSNRLDIEPLLTYRINPFTVFYVGASSGYRRFEPGDYDEDEYVLPTEADWKLSERQFFAKLQVLFRV